MKTTYIQTYVNNEQFAEGYNDLVAREIIIAGDKISFVGMGLYIPKKNVDAFMIEYKK